MKLERTLSKQTARNEVGGGVLKLRDFPFVADVLTSPSRTRDLSNFLVGDVPASERRARLREEMLRWHPDKFSKYLACAREEDAKSVLERVNVMSQAVREAFKAFAAS